ncbi:TolC family protein [Paraburkholderia bannensis]|uniref:TolC family protein n=1 Tax=Paraburkholderia bannensis TaxID=765414 RepID=UPI003898F0D3
MALQIARFDTEKARAARYPSVDLQVTHTPAGAAGGYARPTTTTTGMLSVTIPLYSGGEISAKVDEANALQDKARDELDAAVRDAGANARDAWLRVNSGGMRVSALDDVVRRAQSALEATRIGQRAGSRTTYDVLRATDAFYASRRDWIRARYDTVLATLKLLAQASMLDLDEVGRLNTQLFAPDFAPSHASRAP